MKKTIAMILCLIMLFTLTACAGSDDGDSDRENANNNQPPPATEPEPKTKPAPEPPTKPPPTGNTKDPPATKPPKPAKPPEDNSDDLWEWGLLPVRFISVDLDGNTVTAESWGEKQLFFIHYWATWCGPCIQEMPDLARIASDFGDRVGFIGLLDDYDENPGGAIRLLESSGAPDTFINVDARDRGADMLVDLVRSGYLPTTMIIDAHGNQLTEQLIGAYGEVYADILDFLLENGPG